MPGCGNYGDTRCNSPGQRINKGPAVMTICVLNRINNKTKLMANKADPCKEDPCTRGVARGSCGACDTPLPPV